MLDKVRTIVARGLRQQYPPIEIRLFVLNMDGRSAVGLFPFAPTVDLSAVAAMTTDMTKPTGRQSELFQ